jgi:hypothetical protein
MEISGNRQILKERAGRDCLARKLPTGVGHEAVVLVALRVHVAIHLSGELKAPLGFSPKPTFCLPFGDCVKGVRSLSTDMGAELA